MRRESKCGKVQRDALLRPNCTVAHISCRVVGKNKASMGQGGGGGRDGTVWYALLTQSKANDNAKIILLPSAVHLEEMLTVSQSVS